MEVKKVLVIAAKAHCECNYDDCSEAEAELQVQEFDTLGEAINTLHGDVSVIDIPALLENPSFRSRLESLGWIDKNEAKNRKKFDFGKNIYIREDDGCSYSNTSTIDVDKLTSWELEKLARGGQLLREVSTKSVLSPGEYKKYLTEKKKNEAARKKAQEAAKKRQAKKKQKEIEKARKLLAEVEKK